MKRIVILCSLIIICFFYDLSETKCLAAKNVTKVNNGGYYYIQHVGSGKYLDIRDESNSNGAQLQIWEKASKHQNQVFGFYKVGNYWKIIAHNSTKAIEVRNSQHCNGAFVAQWEYAGIACQQWSVITNNDGTVSFRNRNSGKYLDIYLNRNNNGNIAIQYSGNGSVAQKFRLKQLQTTDVLNAKWQRTFYSTDINWSNYNYVNLNVSNQTRFSINSKYPTPGYTYLEKIEYLDPETVHQILQNKSLKKSTKEKISDILSGQAKDSIKEQIFSILGFSSRVCSYTQIGWAVLEVLATSESTNDWNNFVKTTRSGKGIIKKTYIKIVNNPIPIMQGTRRVTMNYIREYRYYKYQLWSGNGEISRAPYDGKWEFTYK